jgi:hypothetical protein
MRPTFLLRHRDSTTLSITPRWSHNKSDRIQKEPPSESAMRRFGTLPQRELSLNRPITNNVQSTGATFRIPRSILLLISRLDKKPSDPAFVFQPLTKAHQRNLSDRARCCEGLTKLWKKTHSQDRRTSGNAGGTQCTQIRNLQCQEFLEYANDGHQKVYVALDQKSTSLLAMQNQYRAMAAMALPLMK